MRSLHDDFVPYPRGSVAHGARTTQSLLSVLYVRISGRALVDHVEKGDSEQCSLQEVRFGSCQVAYLLKVMVAVEVRRV